MGSNNGLRLTAAAVALVVGAWCAAAFAADGPYYIQATEVNLREQPNGEIILVFDVNDKVFVIERQGNWSYVSAPTREAKGWCWSDYIGDGRVEAAANQPAGVPEDPNAVAVTKLAAPECQAPAGGDLQAAGAPELPAQQEGDVTIEDTAVNSGDPVAVVATGPGEDTTLADLERAAASQDSADESATKQDPVCVAPEASDPLSVFSFGDDAPSGEPMRADGQSGEGAGFIADDPPAAEQAQPASAAQQEVTAVSLPPQTDWRPEAQPPTPEEQQAPFYQPFTPNPRITTPGMLESAFYKPVGGHDLALIKGENVNVRTDKSLKSKILGRVDTGDKLYVIGYDDPWYHVSIPAKQLKGYVYGQYVDSLPLVEVTGDQVRLREKPSLKGRIKTELNSGEVFFEFERQGRWVLVASSASGLKGWVHSDYLKKTTKSISRPYRVTGDSVNFRASPNVDAEIITALPQGTEVAVRGRSQKWSFIEYGGQQGWMYSEYLAPLGRGTVVPQSALGQRLIARAKAMQGTPYVWGGESDGGVDCSGLIYKLLLEEGASAKCLPRRASTQMAGLGVPVDKEDLQPGDLVFFHTYKAGASHVGIYLGDGDFIHASSAKGKVTISNMSEGYYKRRFVGARRISEAELRAM